MQWAKKIGKGNMATHGMIDLETLGVNPDSVLMTIGAVKLIRLAKLNHMLLCTFVVI